METRLTDYDARQNVKKDDPVYKTLTEEEKLRGTKNQVFYVKGRRFQYFYNKLFVLKMDRLLGIFGRFLLGLQV